jgi:hypothetical protein
VGCALAAVVLVVAAPTAVTATRLATGSQRFDGGLVVSNASGTRRVLGSVVAASGVYNGVGRIVERPNRPGDSDKVNRDDLVFPAGTLHIVSTAKTFSARINPQTCVLRIRITQTAAIDGGTRRFAGATGTFGGSVDGSGVARRAADGTCDQKRPPLTEVTTIAGSGTLRY